MSELRAVPIDFRVEAEQRIPCDPQLYAAIQAYCVEQFGAEQDLSKVNKAWAVYETNGDGTVLRVISLGSFVTRLDIPLFHVAPPVEGASKAEWVLAMKARDLLYERMHNWAEDNGGKGMEVLVGVDEKAEGLWQKFLQRIGARKVPRYAVKI